MTTTAETSTPTRPELTEEQQAVIDDYIVYVKDFKIRIKVATAMRKLQKLLDKEREIDFKKQKRPGWDNRFKKAKEEMDRLGELHPIFTKEVKDMDSWRTYAHVKHGMTWGLRAHIHHLLQQRVECKQTFKEYLKKENI